MAKPLRAIVKKGVHGSEIVPDSTGTDPNVDYDPKSPDGQKFIAKHKVQKWAEVNGNKNPADATKKTSRRADNKSNKEAEAAYEDVSCNNTPKGKSCPVHGDKDCKEMSNGNS